MAFQSISSKISQTETKSEKQLHGSVREEDNKTPNKAFVIAVANQKGGVAKTTTVVSLGGAFVNHGQEVLLIDLDAQANLTLALGEDPKRMRAVITEVFFNSATLLSVSRETQIPGLDFVPSNSGMELAERFLTVRKNYEVILKDAFAGSSFERQKPLQTHAMQPQAGNPDHKDNPDLHKTGEAKPLNLNYDFILLDCPPFMGAVTLNAMTAADMLIIPTQPEYFSAHALRTLMSTIRRVREQHNPDLVYRILITIYDQRNRIHRTVCEQIQQTFGSGVFQTIIGIDTKIRESAVAGMPISHHMNKTRSALQYSALAQELIDYVRTRSVETTPNR